MSENQDAQVIGELASYILQLEQEIEELNQKNKQPHIEIKKLNTNSNN